MIGIIVISVLVAGAFIGLSAWYWYDKDEKDVCD